MLIKINRKNKDRKARLNLVRNEMKIRYYKYMRLLAVNERAVENYVKYQKLLDGMPKQIITNYCIITGRSRGVYRKFRMARHQIREKFKYLNGLTNASW